MYKKTAYFSIMISFAMILSYIESLIPFYFGAPGIKLGLANFIVVFMMFQNKAKEAIIMNIIRIILVGFLFGNLFSIVYSLAGGILSFFFMIVCKKLGLFEILGISMIGGITHNVGQILMAFFVLKSVGIFYYIPILLIAGLVTGMLIGLIAREVLKRIPKNGVLI